MAQNSYFFKNSDSIKKLVDALFVARIFLGALILIEVGLVGTVLSKYKTKRKKKKQKK